MIGKMDQLITLRRRVEALDGIGGVELRWVEICTVWANVVAKAGRESMVEGRVNAVFPVVFTIWNRDDVSETTQIVWGGKAYNVRSILAEGGRALTLRIDAEAGGGAA